MKKIIKLFLLLVITISLCGCESESSMENITIYTTSYPIEYVVTRLYKDHSIIRSIYPNGSDIETYEITDILLSEYSGADMFIFNGLSKEQDYIKPMLKENNNLKIIDVANDISYKKHQEELWVNPAKLLNIANNIKKGFKEYINAKYLTDEIDINYEKLKIDLTSLEASYRETIKSSINKNIIVTSDSFQFLSDYGLNVISIDKENEEYEKNLTSAKDLINNNQIKYVYLKNTEENNEDINKLINSTSIKILKLNTLSTLTDEQRNNYDYLTLVNENLELLKKQLYNME